MIVNKLQYIHFFMNLIVYILDTSLISIKTQILFPYSNSTGAC